MVRPGGRLTAAFAVAVFGFALSAYGQSPDWTVIVDGSPVPLPRPVILSGGDLFVPLLPIIRVLGFPVEPLPQLNGLRLWRGAGAAIEYDGRNGEIRYGPVVAGQLRNYKQVTLSGPMEEWMFPVEGLITLFAVDVQLDTGTGALYINSSSGSFNIPSSRRIGVSSIDYSLGITKAGTSEGHYTAFRSDALAGGLPLNSSLLLTGEGADVHLQQATVTAEFGRRRTLSVGDQSAISGIDSLVSSVRGVGFSTLFKTFEASAYAGRTAGSFRAQVGAPGIANYDSTIVGGAMRKRSAERELSFATNSFKGPDRNGTSAGFAFAKATARNQMRAQAVVGTFSGFSLRTNSSEETNLALPLDPAAAPPTEQRVRVEGGALGLSFFNTFKPVEMLTITARLERYGKNFLTAREDSQYSAQSTQHVSVALRPLPTISVYGGLTRRRYLAGDPDVMHGFNYGGTGAVPAMRWLQLGYFRVVQHENSLNSGRTQLSQYSAALNLLQYSGNVIFSDLQTNRVAARTVSATLSRNLSSYGYLTVHDQLQLRSLHRYGVEWQFSIPKGSLRLGFDRLTSLQTADRSYIPLVGLAFTLPGKQRLTATYSGERGMHTLSVVIGGPVVRREDLRKDEDGRVSVIAEASLEGLIYMDSNEDNAFSPESDVAMSGIKVWLDGVTSALTNTRGAFRFDHVKAGAHVIRADLSEVPADMVFADSGERHVAILPFRENVQNFPIVRTGSLTGKVTYLDYSEDPDNPVQKPLPEARVFADGEHDTYSDLSGNITIGSLKPGTYQLKVDPVTVPEGYVASAESIQVRAGEVLRGVQVQLKVPPRPVVIMDLPRQQSVTTPSSGIKQ